MAATLLTRLGAQTEASQAASQRPPCSHVLVTASCSDGGHVLGAACEPSPRGVSAAPSRAAELYEKIDWEEALRGKWMLPFVAIMTKYDVELRSLEKGRI